MFNNQQKTILLYIVASPFFIAIPIFLIIVYFLPNPTSKYKVELEKKEIVNKPNSYVYFNDINNNGIDERVIIFPNIVKNQASVKVMTEDDVNYEQWNFDGYYQKNTYVHTICDLNNDKLPEIYVFYNKNDSVFLGAVQPYPDKSYLFKKKFIAMINKSDGNIDYQIRTLDSYDIDNDGYEELIFSLISGYSKQPRTICIFDLQDDTIKSSFSFGANLSAMVISDLDNDSLPELYFGSSTSANIKDSLIQYNDYSSWLLGFSNSLQLLFPPIENIAFPSVTQICSFVSDSEQSFIAVNKCNYSGNYDTISFYAENGKEFSFQRLEIPKDDKKVRKIIMQEVEYLGRNWVLVGIFNNHFLFINEKLEIEKIESKEDCAGLIFSADLNNDGNTDYVFQSIMGEYVIIYDRNFENVVIRLTNNEFHSSNPYLCGVRVTDTNSKQLYVLAEKQLYYYSYNLNLLYYFKYPLWIFVYLVTVLFLWLTQKLQKIQSQRKQKIEDTINSLQMKTIKSQLDPHFMFNVLNGLAHNVAKGNNDEAHDQILRFSKLLRSLLMRVDRLDVSLGDELDFIKKYLELEKFRFKDDFEFEISLEEEVDLTQRIPRMLIQLLVENSIKHGLRNKEGVKKLMVNVVKTGGKTSIVVEDNGVGRKSSNKKDEDTGKGIMLINDMVRLNHNLGGKDIVISYTDLLDDKGNALGTKVEVLI